MRRARNVVTKPKPARKIPFCDATFCLDVYIHAVQSPSAKQSLTMRSNVDG